MTVAVPSLRASRCSAAPPGAATRAPHREGGRRAGTGPRASSHRARARATGRRSVLVLRPLPLLRSALPTAPRGPPHLGLRPTRRGGEAGPQAGGEVTGRSAPGSLAVGVCSSRPPAGRPRTGAPSWEGHSRVGVPAPRSGPGLWAVETLVGRGGAERPSRWSPSTGRGAEGPVGGAAAAQAGSPCTAGAGPAGAGPAGAGTGRGLRGAGRCTRLNVFVVLASDYLTIYKNRNNKMWAGPLQGRVLLSRGAPPGPARPPPPGPAGK